MAADEFTKKLNGIFAQITKEKLPTQEKPQSERYNKNEPGLFEPQRRWTCQAGCNSNCKSLTDNEKSNAGAAPTPSPFTKP